MRIGLFTDAYFPIIGGVSVSIRTLRNELEKLGHVVYIITNDHERSQEENNVIRIKGHKLPMKVMDEFRIGTIKKSDVRRIGSLDLDIVHCHTEFKMGLLGRRVARRYNLPLIHTYHTMYEDYIHFITKMFLRPLRFLSKKYSKYFANKADKVIFPTVKVQRTFVEYGYKKQSSIIPTGIYLDKFNKKNYPQNEVIKLKEKLGIRHDEFVMLFLGRISREKAIESLIREFAKIKNEKVKLLIVGGGPDLDFFNEVVEEVGKKDKVIFTGMVNPKEIGIYYQVADLFTNFSMSETQGLTYYEALASCVPLLVKYDDNLENVILHGTNGYSFTNDDEFVALAEEIIMNKKIHDHFVMNSCSSVEKYSARNYALNILEIYNNLHKG